MCRLVAYCGPSIPLQNIITKPAHSLQMQSAAAFQSRKLDNGGRALASEPLDKLASNWLAVPESYHCKMNDSGFDSQSLH